MQAIPLTQRSCAEVAVSAQMEIDTVQMNDLIKFLGQFNAALIDLLPVPLTIILPFWLKCSIS